MRHLVYVGLLAACVLGTMPLELALGVRVYARWRQLAMTLLPVVLVFGAWDEWAIATHAWSYDHGYLIDVFLPRHVPIEELLFFLVIPTCAILTLEAVRVRRPHWLIGDERP